MIDFGVTVDRASFDRVVLESSREFLENLLRKKKPILAGLAGRLAGEAVRSSPEVPSLLTGRIRNELGVVSMAEAIDGVVQAVSQSVLVEIDPPRVSGRSLSGGVIVKVFREDLSDLEPLMDAYRFFSRNGEVDWLRWLLTSGTSIAVAGFHFNPVESDRSRTGFGLMTKGGTWSVPSEFAGTAGDNWISRSLDAAGPSIVAALAGELFGA